MSASERLRVLGPPFDLTETHSWIEIEGVMREMNSMAALYDALPLIADVVEAAEEAREVEDYVLSEYEPEGTKLQRALTALRGHLEGQ